jgi:hypothetical protein
VLLVEEVEISTGEVGEKAGAAMTMGQQLQEGLNPRLGN